MILAQQMNRRIHKMSNRTIINWVAFNIIFYFTTAHKNQVIQDLTNYFNLVYHLHCLQWSS